MTRPDLSDNALRSLNTHLREQSHLLQTTLTSISQGILVFDPDTRYKQSTPRSAACSTCLRAFWPHDPR
jgi:hypothetical protein